MLASIKRSCGYEPHGLPLPQSAVIAGYYWVFVNIKNCRLLLVSKKLIYNLIKL